jgi:hypothetical protein
MTNESECLGKFEFIFEINLGKELGDQEGAFNIYKKTEVESLVKVDISLLFLFPHCSNEFSDFSTKLEFLAATCLLSDFSV